MHAVERRSLEHIIIASVGIFIILLIGKMCDAINPVLARGLMLLSVIVNWISVLLIGELGAERGYWIGLTAGYTLHLIANVVANYN